METDPAVAALARRVGLSVEFIERLIEKGVVRI